MVDAEHAAQLGYHHSVRLAWSDKGDTPDFAEVTFLFPEALNEAERHAGAWLIMDGPRVLGHVEAP